MFICKNTNLWVELYNRYTLWYFLKYLGISATGD